MSTKKVHKQEIAQLCHKVFLFICMCVCMLFMEETSYIMAESMFPAEKHDGVKKLFLSKYAAVLVQYVHVLEALA